MEERKIAAKRWSDGEDKLLVELVSADVDSGREINWQEIATHFRGRNNKDCRKRWIYTLNPSVKKGPWSDEEDKLLFEGVQLHGFRWPLISQMIGTRQPDQCSRRWRETLNPNINHNRWTLLEDQLLKQAVDEYGRKWTEIVERYFPDRTPISAKKRYVYRFQKKLRNADGREKPRLSKSSSGDSGSYTSNGEEQDHGSPQEMSTMLWYMPDYSQKRGYPISIENSKGDFETSHSISSSSVGEQESTVPALEAPIISMAQQHVEYQSTMRRPNKTEATQIPGSVYHRYDNQFQSQEDNIIGNRAINGALYTKEGLNDIINDQGNMEYPKDSIRGSPALDMFQNCHRLHSDAFDDWIMDVTRVKTRGRLSSSSPQLSGNIFTPWAPFIAPPNI